jgi:hypothetical protein
VAFGFYDPTPKTAGRKIVQLTTLGGKKMSLSTFASAHPYVIDTSNAVADQGAQVHVTEEPPPAHDVAVALPLQQRDPL